MIKRKWPLWNKYLPGLLVLLILISQLASAQVKQKYPQYGMDVKRFTATAIQLPRDIVGVKDLDLGLDTGQVYYNRTDSTVYVYTGSQWIALGTGTGGGSITGAGDLPPLF